MSKAQRAIAVLLAIGLVAVGLLTGSRLATWRFGGSSARTYSSAALLRQVQTLSQLVSVQYIIEKVIVVEAPPDSVLGQLFAGDNRLLLLAHGIVKAGIDFGRLKPEDIRVDGRTVIVHLPNAQILDAYLDDSQTRIIERKTGFLRTFDKDLEQTTRQNAVDDIRRAARQGGILKEADEHAREQIRGLFLQLGFESVQFEN